MLMYSGRQARQLHVCEIPARNSCLTHLLWAERVRRLHEVRTDHGEGDTVAVLRRELHALLELALEQVRVEAAA